MRNNDRYAEEFNAFSEGIQVGLILGLIIGMVLMGLIIYFHLN
jgi:tetrahydromethanopterin S-methyltransferase subunit F